RDEASEYFQRHAGQGRLIVVVLASKDPGWSGTSRPLAGWPVGGTSKERSGSQVLDTIDTAVGHAPRNAGPVWARPPRREPTHQGKPSPATRWRSCARGCPSLWRACKTRGMRACPHSSETSSTPLSAAATSRVALFVLSVRGVRPSFVCPFRAKDAACVVLVW